MSGYGGQPAGTSPAGYGTPEQATEPLGSFLTLPNGTISTARYIDPVTRDYVLDASTGRLVGMNWVRQMVQLCVHTERGSAAVRDMGNELRKIDRITSNFVNRCLLVLTDALRSPIQQGLVQVLGFTAFKAGRADGLKEGQTYGHLRWKDLTTGIEHKDLV